jgi:hypothetical protein
VSTEQPAADQSEILRLKSALLTAQDAAHGAIAELASVRAINKELDHLIHQLRVELAEIRSIHSPRSTRLLRIAGRPVRVLRRALR